MKNYCPMSEAEVCTKKGRIGNTIDCTKEGEVEVYMCVCEYVCICVYVCMYVCVYVSRYVCMFVFVY